MDFNGVFNGFSGGVVWLEKGAEGLEPVIAYLSSNLKAVEVKVELGMLTKLRAKYELPSDRREINYCVLNMDNVDEALAEELTSLLAESRPLGIIVLVVGKPGKENTLLRNAVEGNVKITI